MTQWSNKNNWKKKFSIGLAMNTTLQEFDSFLFEMGEFIDNVYVSLPLGDRFHGREYIQNQFHNPATVTLFWDILKLIQTSGISIEVVYNEYRLQERDLQLGYEALEKHGIEAQKIAVMDKNFEAAKCIYPEAKIIKSVNDMPNSVEEIRNIVFPYDEIVVGRQYIRSEEVFRLIKSEKKAETILLLNNGCSHICGGCGESKEYCYSKYKIACREQNYEYLYALQSILPYEIHENYFDMKNVDYLKLSTRNANTNYIKKCMLSYINNDAEKYIKEDINNYLLWSRLAWPIEHFGDFNFESIKMIKKEICMK